MSAFNGAGVFVISGVGLPFVTGTTISSTVANQLNNDLATGLSTCLTKDGQSVPIANIPLGGFKLTGVGAPTAPGDALVFGQPATVGNLTVNGNATISGTLTVPGGITAPGIAGANKIINGDFRINQRGLSAPAFTNTSVFFADRFQASSSGMTTQTMQAAIVASSLAGCLNSGKVTITGGGAAPAASAFAFVCQRIEGFNTSDLLWGTAQAKPIAISFRAKAGIGGDYGLLLRNDAGTRTYVAVVTLVANTDTAVAITVPGDTAGVWTTDNSQGLFVGFDLGAGAAISTAGNVWQAGSFNGLTGGVKLIATTGGTFEFSNLKVESGSVATPFVPDDYAVSFEKCQRYFMQFTRTSSQMYAFTGMVQSTTHAWIGITFPVTMRAAPTLVIVGTHQLAPGGGGGFALLSLSGHTGYPESFLMDGAVVGPMTVGQAIQLQATATPAAVQFNAEL